MQFRDLGPLELEVDDLAVPLSGRRLASVLALLAFRVGDVVESATLIDAVWPQDPPLRAAASLESLIWRLRKVVEPDRRPRQTATVLRTEEIGYRLAVPPDNVDSKLLAGHLRLVRRLLEQRRFADALVRAEAGAALWRGEPFGGVPDADWLALARSELTGWRTDLAECRVQALLETAQPERAIGLLGPLLIEQPFRERLWAQRMLGLYRAGRQGAALETFQQVRQLLSEELGVDPGVELRDLHRRILDQDQELVLRRGAVRAGDTGEVHLPGRRTTFIGRADDLAAVVALLSDSSVVTLTGPGGTGKTRLAVEAAYSVRGSFPDGVYFIDLTQIQEPELVPLIVAQRWR